MLSIAAGAQKTNSTMLRDTAHHSTHLRDVDVNGDGLAEGCAIAIGADGGADGLRQGHCNHNSSSSSRWRCSIRFHTPQARRSLAVCHTPGT